MLAAPPAVLITDDDRAWREALVEAFPPPKFRTLLAADGAEAVEIVKHEHIDLVLLDMHMPRLSGLDTIRQVRTFRAELPCILISGELDERIRRDALELRAFSVLSKPIRLLEVRRVVHQALRCVYDWRQDLDVES